MANEEEFRRTEPRTIPARSEQPSSGASSSDMNGERITGESGDLERYEEISRRWRRSLSPAGRRQWKSWSAVDAAWLSTWVLLMACLPLVVPDFPWPVPSVPFTAAGLTLIAATLVLNAWLVDRYLQARTPTGPLIPFGLRLLRLPVGALPLLNLALIAVWRDLVQRRIAKANQSMPPVPLRLDRASVGGHGTFGWVDLLVSSRLRAWGSLVWLSAGNILLLLGVSVAVARGSDGLFKQASVVGACLLALRVLGFLAASTWKWHQVRTLGLEGWRRVAALAIPLCWWLPIWLLFLILILDALLDPESRRRETLVHRAFAGFRFADPVYGPEVLRSGTLLGWKRLPPRQETAQQKSQETTWSEERRRALYRLKVLLLGLDGIALGWIGAALAFGLSWSSGGRWALVGVAVVLGSLAGAGMVELLRGRIGGRTIRATLQAASYRVAGALFLLTGILLGVLFATGWEQLAGGVLAVVALGTFVIWWLGRLLVLGASQHADLLLWGGLSLALLTLGYSMMLFPPGILLRDATKAFFHLTLLLPLWHAVLGLRLGGSLLHPFSLASVLRMLPRRPGQRTLFWMGATLFLPLGGLAVPFWIFRRQETWEALVREWQPQSRAVPRRRDPSRAFDFSPLFPRRRRG
jgi:hypothetical protein